MQRIAMGMAGLLLVVLAGGCGGGPPPLMPTPTLYANGSYDPFPGVPPALQSNKVQVLYVTDRGYDEKSTKEAPKYGIKRSRSVVFGVSEVEFGKDVPWDQVVKASTSEKRTVDMAVHVNKITEICRFPPTPKTLVELPAVPIATPGEGDGPVTTPAGLDELHQSLNKCRDELSARLANSPVKDVYVFVHGVANTFDDSMITTASLWHFLGREGVAVAYTWPAGGKGLLRGYTYDYNSSEFTVYHLKETLKAIAGCKDVRKIHIIAHSRGTDVTVTALRELHLEIGGSGRSTREVIKLGTVILAAADLDVDVVMQRAATARLGKVPERSVIYISSTDEALGFSQFLFGGGRLGKLKPDIFTVEELEALRKSPNLSIIDARVKKPGAFGHNYFYSNPAVSSDLILVLRYGRSPGAEHGRPLKSEGKGFWQIDDQYPGKLNPAADKR